MKTYKYRVEKNIRGVKLQVFLKQKLGEEWSVRKVKGLIDKNRCRLNGKIERFGCTPLDGGDRVELTVGNQTVAAPKVVFEDEHLLVLDKPGGMTVDRLEMGILCHRLDRDTSGLIILAKEQEVADDLERTFREREVKKRYLALVDGIPEEREGRIDNRIGAVGRFDGQRMIGSQKRGAQAKTYWELVRRVGDASLVACHPLTGRTHQIRVHMAGLGHPILGDGQYSRRFRCTVPMPRHMLHAERLVLPHPVTGERLALTAKLPADFRDAMERLKACRS